METLTLIHRDGHQTTSIEMTFESISIDELEDYFARASQAIGHSYVQAVEVKGITFEQRAENRVKVTEDLAAGGTYYNQAD